MVVECIPDYKQIEKWAALALEYGLSFEYNDFFNPMVLENTNHLNEIIRSYERIGRDTSQDTMHGAFYDITVNSMDPLIRNASDKRVRQCMDIAERLKVRGVVFHTNYLTDFKSVPYRDGWVAGNTEYWDKICSEYRGIQVYLENMFDDTPELLRRVAENLKDINNFGVCLDLAHAFLSKVDLKQWVDELSPYVKHIHINDNDKQQDLHLLVGSGKLDWSILRSEKLFGLSPSVLIEVSGKEKLIRSIDYLKSINFLK